MDDVFVTGNNSSMIDNFKDTSSSTCKEIMQDLDDYVYEAPLRGTRLLANIYQSCNVAVLEPAEFEETKNDPKWIEVMKDEIWMIEKNQTWELVDMPKHKNTYWGKMGL